MNRPNLRDYHLSRAADYLREFKTYRAMVRTAVITCEARAYYEGLADDARFSVRRHVREAMRARKQEA